MAKKKWKKRLKKIAKAALIGGALYGGAKLLGRQGTRSVNPIGGLDEVVRKKAARNKAIDLGIQAAEADKESDMYVPNKFKMPEDPMRYQFPKYQFQKKGGRISKKHGGRTRKQFGGALPVGGTARRDMRSGYYPSDMGMRGGPMYKKGGRVTGIAKRGFGRALMKGKK